MDADERLLALKKAYADIILNTSKEAAIRVMASERKAQRLQYELGVTKEEALRMTLRLKKMMDDKITEAAVTSKNQQDKIDELEAQLQEAEDIVSQVRNELREVEDKYESLITNELHCPDKHNNATLEEALGENIQNAAQSVMCLLEPQNDSLAVSDKENLHMHQRTELPRCYNELLQTRNIYGAKPELPSIILRNKKQEFYRNGCTQRIRACERNIVDGELSLSRQRNDASSNGTVGTQKQDKGKCGATTDGVGMTCNIESKEAVHKDGSISCWYELQATNVIPMKTIAAKHRKSRSTSGKKIPDKLFMKINRASDLCCPNPSARSVENNAHPDNNPSHMALRLSSGIRDEAKRVCAATTEKNGDNVKECDVEKITSKGEASLISVPIVQGVSTESSINQVSRTNLKKLAGPVIHSDFKTMDATDEGPSLPVDPRAIKFTFQRKRKRDNLSISDGHVPVENSIPEKKEKKQMEPAEPEKCSLASQSRQLAEVARQRVAFSGKQAFQT